MAFPLPTAFRKKMAMTEGTPEAPNPMGVSESESDAPEMKGEKPNPLKTWAANKLAGG